MKLWRSCSFLFCVIMCQINRHLLNKWCRELDCKNSMCRILGRLIGWWTGALNCVLPLKMSLTSVKLFSLLLQFLHLYNAWQLQKFFDTQNLGHNLGLGAWFWIYLAWDCNSLHCFMAWSHWQDVQPIPLAFLTCTARTLMIKLPWKLNEIIHREPLAPCSVQLGAQ